MYTVFLVFACFTLYFVWDVRFLYASGVSLPLGSFLVDIFLKVLVSMNCTADFYSFILIVSMWEVITIASEREIAIIAFSQ